MKSTIDESQANAIITGALKGRRTHEVFGRSPGSADIDFDDEEEELPPPPPTFFNRLGRENDTHTASPALPPHRGPSKGYTGFTNSTPAPYSLKSFKAPEIPPPPLPTTPAPRLSAGDSELEGSYHDYDGDAEKEKEDDVFVTPKRKMVENSADFTTPKTTHKKIVARDSVVLKNLQRKGGLRDLVSRFEESTNITYDRQSDKYNLSFQRNFVNHQDHRDSHSVSPIRNRPADKYDSLQRPNIWKSTTTAVEYFSDGESNESDMDIVSVSGYVKSPSRKTSDRVKPPRLPSIDFGSEKRFSIEIKGQREPSPPVTPVRRQQSDIEDDAESVSTYLNPRKLSLSQFPAAPLTSSTPYSSKMQPLTPRNQVASASSSMTTAVVYQTTPTSHRNSQNSRFTFATPTPIVWSTNGTPVGNGSIKSNEDNDTLSAKFRSSWGMKKTNPRPSSPVTWEPQSYAQGSVMRMNSRKENRSFQSDVASLGIPIQYTMSLASIPTPPTAIRVSSQRRLPYNSNSVRLLAADSPLTTPRRISMRGTHSLPHWTPRRVDLDDSIVSYETTNEYVPESDFHRFMERLELKVRSEEKHIREARSTVAYWRRAEHNKHSMNEFCAHALVLISEHRLTIYRELISRINTFLMMRVGPPPVVVAVRSVFTIFNMRVALARDFYLRNNGDDTPYVFLAIGSTSEKVIASQVMDVNETGCIRARHVVFDDMLCFKNLPINFTIEIFFYAFKLTTRSMRTPKAIAKKAMKFLGSAVKSPSTSNTNLNMSSHSKGSSRIDGDDEAGGFVNVGKIFLTRFTQGQVNIGINNCQWPLDPTVSLNCKCTPLPGKLDQELSGAWTLIGDPVQSQLYYVRMIHGVIHMFHGADDSLATALPLCGIDLSNICDKSVERMDSDDLKYQYVFQFDLLSFPRGDENCEHKRYRVAVESLDLLRMWLTAINGALHVIRGVE